MFQTLRTRALFIVAGIVIATTLTITFFVQRETVQSIYEAHEETAINLLNTILLNVEGQYESIVFHKDEAMKIRKNELRNITGIAINNIANFYSQYKKGRMTKKEAQHLALNELNSLRYDEGVGYIWINDTGRPIPRMIMHPTIPDLDGKVLDDPRFNCALGIKKNLFQAFVDVCMEKGEGYVDYLWPKPTSGGLTTEQPKLSFVKLFKPWNWIVGTGVYIDDIEKYRENRLNAVISELKQTFGKVKVAQCGYMFLFTGEQEMLIHPSREKSDFKTLLNPSTNNPILVDLMKAAQTPGVPYEYLWESPSGSTGDFIHMKRAYVQYFEPLNWYICSTFYNDEIEKPIEETRNKTYFLAGIILLAALILSLLFSRSLTRPLQRLSQAALQIEEHGVPSTSIPVTGTSETQKLGTVLNKMLDSINQKETALRAEEKELKSLRNYLKNIIDSMPSILVGVDNQGRITQWNREAAKTTGLTPEQARSKSMGDIFPKWKLETKKIQQAIKERRPIVEERVPGAIDESSFVDITIYPLVADQAKGAVIRIDDVTRRVRIEEMMVQTEKMMSVGGLAAGMAHEINNPLGIILQSIQNTRRRISPDFEKNLAVADECGVNLEKLNLYLEKRNILRYFEAVQEAGQRAAKIVLNMLNFSRRSESKTSWVNINLLLDETLELVTNDYDLKKKYDFRRVEINRQYDLRLPEIPCVKTEIEQVMLNLVKNAAQAMCELNMKDYKPEITIRTSDADDYVLIEVMDNGPGMDESTRKRVFEPFFTTKPAGIGTGLGLSVSYFIITTNHLGKMSVNTAPGGGTVFKIWLPFHKRKENK